METCNAESIQKGSIPKSRPLSFRSFVRVINKINYLLWHTSHTLNRRIQFLPTIVVVTTITKVLAMLVFLNTLTQ